MVLSKLGLDKDFEGVYALTSHLADYMSEDDLVHITKRINEECRLYKVKEHLENAFMPVFRIREENSHYVIKICRSIRGVSVTYATVNLAYVKDAFVPLERLTHTEGWTAVALRSKLKEPRERGLIDKLDTIKRASLSTVLDACEKLQNTLDARFNLDVDNDAVKIAVVVGGQPAAEFITHF